MTSPWASEHRPLKNISHHRLIGSPRKASEFANFERVVAAEAWYRERDDLIG